MNNGVYTAENSTDMFDIQIPQFDTLTEIPAPPVYDETQTEFDSFLDKSFVSFGTLIVCIIFILLAAIIIKKKKQKKEIDFTEDVPEEKYETEIKIQEPSESSFEYVKQHTKKHQTLNTPSSIHKCIKSFLENTKDI